jgi:arginine repressor
MPSETNSETRGAILAHHYYELFSREIVLKMEEMGTSVSQSTVARVIKKKRLEQEGLVKPPKRLGAQNSPTVRTKSAIEKVR